MLRILHSCLVTDIRTVHVVEITFCSPFNPSFVLYLIICSTYLIPSTSPHAQNDWPVSATASALSVHQARACACPSFQVVMGLKCPVLVDISGESSPCMVNKKRLRSFKVVPRIKRHRARGVHHYWIMELSRNNEQVMIS
jgi:hypothetical protein